MTDKSSPIVPYIVLTGTIGSGKSLAAEIFESLGAIVIDTDLLSRRVTAPGTQGLALLIERFGEEILYHTDGTLNRKALGEQVFSDQQSRLDLEAILHPLILEEFLEELEKAFRLTPPLIIGAIPLFYETQIKFPQPEAVVLICASEKFCLERIIARDGISKEEALKRIQAQMPEEEKKQKANYCIENNGTREELEVQVKALFQKLREPL